MSELENELEKLYLMRDTIDLLYTYGGDFEVVIDVIDNEIKEKLNQIPKIEINWQDN